MNYTEIEIIMSNYFDMSFALKPFLNQTSMEQTFVLGIDRCSVYTG